MITGIRIVLENGVYSLKIQEGELLPNAKIDEGTVEWKNVRYSQSSDEVYSQTLGYKKNKIFLDDLEYPDENYVLVGVMLSFDKNYGAVYLQARFMGFDSTSGQLAIDSDSGWYSKIKVEKR